jgi:hypothetical protein
VDWYGHLSADDIDLAFETPSFTQLVTDAMGPYGGPDDGMDAQLLQIMSDTAALGAAIDLIDPILGFLAGPAPGLDDNALLRVTPLFQANLAAVGGDLTDLSALAATEDIQPPSDAPPVNQQPTLTVQTPNGWAACQNAVTFIDTTVAAGPNLNTATVNITGPYSEGTTFVSATLVPNGDAFGQSVGYEGSVKVIPPTLYHLFSITANFTDPGLYWVQVDTVWLFQGQQNTIRYCVRITAQ